MAPEEAGSSPAGHPITIFAGDLAISGVSYALRAGSILAPATTGRQRAVLVSAYARVHMAIDTGSVHQC